MPVVADINEVRRFAVEDAGRQYELFQYSQRNATADARTHNEAIIHDLSSL